MAYIWSLLIALAVTITFAEAARRDNRQARQQSRIQQGVKSGELTKGEAAKARAQQRGVRRAERRAEADGEVTDAEKARIEKRQDRASKTIHRLKHNDRKRGEGKDEGGGQDDEEAVPEYGSDSN